MTTTPARPELVAAFRDLHRPGRPLLMPNAWDTGSARVLASLGYRALATTSSGFAATLGRLDGTVTREQALRHAADIVAATALPVSADLENGFADDPDGVAALVRDAIAVGLAGCSIEDSTGRPDLPDTIARLRSFQDAGADVLYAPGLKRAEDIKAVVRSVDRPVNVLAMAGAPSVAELADLGVSRVSVGGAFAFAALDALVTAARELLDEGTYGYAQRSVQGAGFARTAFGQPAR